jgi:hypothetical protein
MGSSSVASPSFSMGGFFSALVVASVCFLLLGAKLRRDRLSMVVVIIFLLSGTIVSFFPDFFNLRYVSFWMMFLVIGCLLLLRGPALQPYLQSYKIVLISSLVFVTSVTGGIYFIPKWDLTQDFVDRTGVRTLLEPVVQAGDVICLEQGKDEWDSRFTIIFSPIFHQKLAKERPYAIREGGCAGFKTIPRGKFY